MVDIKMEMTIPEERVQDLLTSAFEGGSNYWYLIKSYIFPGTETKESLGIQFLHVELPFKGGKLVIGTLEDDMPDKILDMDSIRKGLAVMAEKYPSHFGDFMIQNDDATTGDVFLQCCLYEEAVYG